MNEHLVSWMRSFIACCDEQAWDAAAEVLRRHDGARDITVARSPSLTAALAVFARRAPASAVEPLRQMRWLNVGAAADAWRSALINRLIHGHAQLLLLAAVEHDFVSVRKHLEAAIELRAPTQIGEAIIAGAFAHSASAVGRVERGLACGRQTWSATDIRSLPANDIFHSGLRCDGYQPCLLASCVNELLRNAASDDLIEAAIRSVAVNAQPPSLHELGRLIAKEILALGPPTRSVLSCCRNELSEVAVAQLLCALEAAPPEECE